MCGCLANIRRNMVTRLLKITTSGSRSWPYEAAEKVREGEAVEEMGVTNLANWERSLATELTLAGATSQPYSPRGRQAVRATLALVT